MDQFAIDVDKGLSSNPKYLHSKYFYDKKGDKIFQKIMSLDEYYLTGSEFEILEKYKDPLLQHIISGTKNFELVEFGAGDGLKTKILLGYFLDRQVTFKYLPIDISKNALNGLMQDLDATYPTLDGHAINDDYFRALHNLRGDQIRKVVMFLGSNIGNFTPTKALEFLQNMHKELNSGDYLLIGIDLKKDPEIILRAYNDSQGVTKQFNLNLLERINEELGANFDLNNFHHAPRYDPDRGAALSYLVSAKDQTIDIAAIGKSFEFRKYEKIATEISQKYSIPEIEALATSAGFEVVEHFLDSRGYFVDTLWTIK